MFARPVLRNFSVSKPLALSLFTTARRAMSSGKTFEYLVVVPDKPGVLAKRLEVRP